MVYKILGLLISTTAMAQLRTTDFQQSLNASAPRNYIKNSGAEKNDLNVTDADTIVSRTTTDPLEGVGSFIIDANSSLEKALFTADDLQAGLLGQSCEATFNYLGDAALYKAYVTLAGTTVSAEQTLLNSGTNSQAASIVFPCGASTTADPAVIIEATSASAASIKVDSVYLGKALNIGTSAQAETVLKVTRISSSQSIGSTAATKVQFNSEILDAYGEFDPTTNYRFTASRAGNYKVGCSLGLGSITSGDPMLVSIYKNGSEFSTSRKTYAGTTGSIECAVNLVPLAIGEYVEIFVASGTDTSYTVSDGGSTFMVIERFPDSTQIVQRGNVTDLSGLAKSAATVNCAWTSTSASLASFAVDADCPSFTTSGNATGPSTKIPAFVVPTLLPGRYEIIASGQISAAQSTSGSQSCSFELHDGSISGGIVNLDTQVNTGTSATSTLVGQFEYSSLQSGKQFEIRTRRNSGNGVCAVDASTADLTLTIIPISQGLPKPFIPGSVFAGRSSVAKMGSARMRCFSSSSITSNPDSMIASIGNISAGTCTVTFGTAYWTTAPICTISRSSGAASKIVVTTDSETTTTMTISGVNNADGAATDFTANLFCVGT